MDSKFPLWCMRVSRLLELYDGIEGAILEPHHILKARKDVVRIQRGKNAKIIFISHEWYDYNHPDPSGFQLKHLCAVSCLLSSSVCTHSYHYNFFPDTETIRKRRGGQRNHRLAYAHLGYRIHHDKCRGYETYGRFKRVLCLA